MERIETTILRNLLCNEQFYRKVVPFVKPDYFNEIHEKVIYEEVWNFASTYELVPTKEVLTINLEARKDLNEEVYQNAVKTIAELNDLPSNTTGCSTQQKSGVRIEQSISPYWSRSRSQMIAIQKYQRMRSQQSFRRPWQFRSTNM
jgi:hypothetical protein